LHGCRAGEQRDHVRRNLLQSRHGRRAREDGRGETDQYVQDLEPLPEVTLPLALLLGPLLEVPASAGRTLSGCLSPTEDWTRSRLRQFNDEFHDNAANESESVLPTAKRPRLVKPQPPPGEVVL
jgi:hypothetical protein